MLWPRGEKVSDYVLTYWPVPFRGQFVRAVLAYVGASWDEVDDFEVVAMLKDQAPAEQPVPYMGPPVLTDCTAGFTISQMPAILLYLGRRHGLIPDDPVLEALTVKTIADANDVLYEMTLYNGNRMWTTESWTAFRPRLLRWMEMFEETGNRHGLTPEAGMLLGTNTPGLADLTAYTLWGTMTSKLPALRPVFDRTAPAVAGLSDRIGMRPEQAELRFRSDAAYGDVWCGGEIQASLRAVL